MACNGVHSSCWHSREIAALWQVDEMRPILYCWDENEVRERHKNSIKTRRLMLLAFQEKVKPFSPALNANGKTSSLCITGFKVTILCSEDWQRLIQRNKDARLTFEMLKGPIGTFCFARSSGIVPRAISSESEIVFLVVFLARTRLGLPSCLISWFDWSIAQNVIHCFITFFHGWHKNKLGPNVKANVYFLDVFMF